MDHAVWGFPQGDRVCEPDAGSRMSGLSLSLHLKRREKHRALNSCALSDYCLFSCATWEGKKLLVKSEKATAVSSQSLFVPDTQTLAVDVCVVQTNWCFYVLKWSFNTYNSQHLHYLFLWHFWKSLHKHSHRVLQWSRSRSNKNLNESLQIKKDVISESHRKEA